MRAILITLGVAIAATGFTAAPAMTAQRAPATFIPPSVGEERFLESWFGAELRSAGLRPLWTERGLDGYRERYRLLFAAGSTGVTIVTIDVDPDGTGVVTATRKRPGGIVERDQRAVYIPGRVAWSEQFGVNRGATRSLRRVFDAQHFFARSFRAETPLPEEAAATCGDGVGYLIELRDRSGYHAITRDNCDAADARALIDAVLKLSDGAWPRR
ncbi:hypothetical protein OF829_07020 [Sphingomonas sp. LB-2]|uniref:hypothetical protein n=1 Tax=Sphingomonas caeni TaxID=2984949 RepID=UPI002231F053|nr:hypothetical protein [Sphingomonas caeni]MCW3846986.1 hypothetical protein [Sphingomonas caeni]